METKLWIPNDVSYDIAASCHITCYLKPYNIRVMLEIPKLDIK